jgi:DNA-binding transcriptional MerR regulator
MDTDAARDTAEDPAGPGQRRLTIDELARAAGTTSRNVRALQSAGLIGPPQVEGRTGFYGPEDLARLRATRRLQREGFSLAAVRALFDASAARKTLDEVIGIGPGEARAADEDHLGYAWLEDWRGRRRGRVLAVVPSSLLEPAAS